MAQDETIFYDLSQAGKIDILYRCCQWNIFSIIVFNNVEGKMRCLAGQHAADRAETPLMSTSYRLCRTVADRARSALGRSASLGRGRRIGRATPILFAIAPAFRFSVSLCLPSLSFGTSAGGLFRFRPSREERASPRSLSTSGLRPTGPHPVIPVSECGFPLERPNLEQRGRPAQC